jgi:vacuolar iron transporter family protein
VALIESRLFSDKALLLEDMAHKELGICPGHFEEPAGNALAMGLAYIVGGTVPLVPYMLLPLTEALSISIVAVLLALAAVGGLKGRLVGKPWWRSGLEMAAVAGAAALAGFLIGGWAGAGR